MYMIVKTNTKVSSLVHMNTGQKKKTITEFPVSFSICNLVKNQTKYQTRHYVRLGLRQLSLIKTNVNN